MSPQDHSRRSFVRKAVGASSLGIGLAIGSQSVAANGRKIKVTGDADGGNYDIGIKNGSDISGSVDDGETNSHSFSGTIEQLRLDGPMDVNADAGDDIPVGDVVVSGTGSGYSFAADEYVSGQDDLESTDGDASRSGYGVINSYNDTDTFRVHGHIIQAHNRDDGTVLITYELP